MTEQHSFSANPVDQVHRVAVDGDRISRDTVYCGGRWPAALLAEMEAARAH